MITVKITGGLGNQMFQYAAGLALANKHGVDLALDISEYEFYKLYKFELDRMPISARVLESKGARAPYFVRKFLRRWGQRIGWGSDVYRETSLKYDPKFFELASNATIQGYFQSEKYFSSVESDLKKEFFLKKQLQPKHFQLREQMRQTNSVMLHVRRGDYVSNPQALKVHGVCSPDYYSRAMQWLESKLDATPKYHVFSNDMDWVRRHLPMPPGSVYVQGNENDPIVELELMSSCRHHVIANSTFSWWAAWLGRHDTQHVVTPHPWFEATNLDSSDLIPSRWHSINK